MRRYSAVAEFDIANLRPHRYGCRCGDDGRCEQASLALRDEADRRACPTISPKRRPRDGEQEGEVASVASLSGHHKEGTPALHAEVPVMSPRTGSEAR